MLDPTSFHGMFQIVNVGDALLSFFNDIDADFGPLEPLDGNKDDLLMDHLPLAKSGWLMRSTVQKLLYIYISANNLRYGKNSAFSDKIMLNSFWGDIPAAFYIYRDDDTHKVRIIKMQDAVDEDLIVEPLNVYDVLKSKYADFDPNDIRFIYFMQIITCDTYTKNKILNDPDPEFNQLAEQFDNEEVKEGALHEYYIVDNAFKQWKEINKNRA